MKPDRVLLIGQAPLKDGDPRRPLIFGPIGQRLRELFGGDLREYVRRTERLNLLPAYQGMNGQRDRFPTEEAREAAIELMPRLHGRRVLFVGHGVARAFGLKGTPVVWRHKILVTTQLGMGGAPVGTLAAPMNWAICPHPSALNRWWNVPANQAAALAFFGEFSSQRRKTPCEV